MSGYFTKVASCKLILTLVLFITLNSCDNNPVIPKDPEFSLTAEDATCIEAWLSLKTTAAYNVNLFRNDSLIMTIKTTAGTDTIIFDEGLLPSQEYTYKAEISIEGKTYFREATIRTMDTTSHDYSGQSWEFGEHSSSFLNDVAIINENNIWAVGVIQMKDSLGNPEPIAYNAVHWDGEKWELKKISVEFRGYITTGELFGIYALSENEIWLSAGVPIKGDGKNWKLYHLFDMGILNQNDGHITKIWANPYSAYFVGTLGSIVNYNGTSWKKIESGTDLRVTSVVGLSGVDNLVTVYAAAQDAILKIKDLTVSRIEADPGMWVYSLWGKREELIYTAGEGLVLYKNNKWVKDESLKRIFYVKGEDHNNIAALGGDYSIYHFNGVNWKSTNVNGIYSSVDIKDNLIAAVGWNNDRAVVTILNR